MLVKGAAGGKSSYRVVDRSPSEYIEGIIIVALRTLQYAHAFIVDSKFY